jgi:hydroxymethylpyrimidine/phosphomethylpyrimidine kinase
VLPAALVRAQIDAAFATGRVDAIKIGMLGTRAVVLAVAASLAERSMVPVVVDPVLAATSGAILLDAAGQAALREMLLPRATLLTPNIPEVAALLGVERAGDELQLLQQGRALLALGARAMLLKGGHGSGELATDLLLTATAVQRLSAPRAAREQRGTGCALGSAIAAGLAAGMDMLSACGRAKNYVTQLLQRR